MQLDQNRAVSKGALWIGRVLSALITLFLLIDAGMKIARMRVAVDATVKLGYSDGAVVSIGMTLLISTILYAIPRTSGLGAVLLTGYLGGAVATNVRAGLPLATYVLAPVYFGIVAWLGLYLRNPQVRRVVPLLTDH